MNNKIHYYLFAIFMAFPLFGLALEIDNLNATKCDSIVVHLRETSSPYSRLSIIVKDAFCYSRIDSIRTYDLNFTSKSILSINDSILERTTCTLLKYHILDEDLSGLLTSLIDVLFVSKSERIFQSYYSYGGILNNIEPNTTISITLHYSDKDTHAELSYELIDDGICTNNDPRTMLTDVRQYSLKCREFIILLHYLAIKEKINIKNHSDILYYVKQKYPNLSLD